MYTVSFFFWYSQAKVHFVFLLFSMTKSTHLNNSGRTCCICSGFNYHLNTLYGENSSSEYCVILLEQLKTKKPDAVFVLYI